MIVAHVMGMPVEESVLAARTGRRRDRNRTRYRRTHLAPSATTFAQKPPARSLIVLAVVTSSYRAASEHNAKWPKTGVKPCWSISFVS